MTNYAEEGLASLFSKHGCSTGSEDGWTVVERKKKKHKTANHATNDNLTPPPVLSSKIDLVNGENLTNPEDMNQAHMGVSPFEAKNNKYTTLSYWENDYEESEEDDEDLEEGEIKETKMSPPMKKIKLESDQYQDQDVFDKLLEDFKQMDAEVALSAIEARDTVLTKPNKNGNFIVNVPDQVNTSNKNDTVIVSTDTADDIESSEAIANFEENENYYFDRENPKIVEESNKILQLPDATLWDYEVKNLPKLYNLAYPVSTQILAFHSDEIEQAHQEFSRTTPWRSHGIRKKQELKIDESTFIMYEIKRLNMHQQYKEHWELMEKYYDDWCIPHNYRSIFRIHELNYISLMIHDILPTSYMKILSPTDSKPKGKLFNYFEKYDDVKSARMKWLSAIKKDYIWFWKTLHEYHPKIKLSSYEIVKFDDLSHIIKFINPKAWFLAISDPIYSKRIAKITQNAKFSRHWVVTRHKFYYEWLFFGWKQLPKDYPLHRSPQNSQYPDHITNWVPKRFLHKNYTNQDLFFRDDDKDFVPLYLQKSIDENQDANLYFCNDDHPDTIYSYVNEDQTRTNATNNWNENIEENGIIKIRHRWLNNHYFKLDESLYDEIKFNLHFHDLGYTSSTDSDRQIRRYKNKITQEYTTKTNMLSSFFKHKVHYDKYRYDISTFASKYDIPLQKIDFEDYHPLSTNFIPYNRKITPDWLRFMKNIIFGGDDNNFNVNVAINDHINIINLGFGDYDLYVPSVPPYKCTIHNKFYNTNNHTTNLTTLVRPIRSNAYSKKKCIVLWRELQARKDLNLQKLDYLENTILKFDKNNNFIYHPL